MIKNDKILVTGSAGFIGMHLCDRLLSEGYEVLGLDNLNNYYDPSLKKDRLNELLNKKKFSFIKADITNLSKIDKIFKKFRPIKVVNLAAQAGVRYSLENPHAYINTNISGFMNILECCRKHEIEGLIYASSSSVYGNNKKHPFSVKDRVDDPISIYAASKKANELMANTYSHLYNLRTTGLRFFTVYGPWGRPDMAMYIFAKKTMDGKKISLFNNGNMERDFTYIDDIIDGILSSIEKNYSCEVFNLGSGKPIKLMDMVRILEKNINKKAKIKFEQMQLGDVEKTYADLDRSAFKLNYKPTISIEVGVKNFINWFNSYYDFDISN